jgi:hypothetical protein
MRHCAQPNHAAAAAAAAAATWPHTAATAAAVDHPPGQRTAVTGPWRRFQTKQPLKPAKAASDAGSQARCVQLPDLP